MAATFMPTGDHGLSEAAQGLNSDRLENEILVAERVLGLAGSRLTGGDAEAARTCVAKQVNLQVRHASQGDVVAESKGSQSFNYAQVRGRRVPVDSEALAAAQSLLIPDGWSTVASLRTGR